MMFPARASVVQGSTDDAAPISESFIKPVGRLETRVGPELDENRASATRLVLDQGEETTGQPAAARHGRDIELLDLEAGAGDRLTRGRPDDQPVLLGNPGRPAERAVMACRAAQFRTLVIDVENTSRIFAVGCGDQCNDILAIGVSCRTQGDSVAQKA